MKTICVLFLTILAIFACQSTVDTERVFLNEWAVEVRGGETVARNVAEDHGLFFIRKIGSLENKYHLSRGVDIVRSKRAADDVTEQLKEDERVLWVSQQPETSLGRRTHKYIAPDVTGDDYDISFNDQEWHKQWYLHNDGQQGAVPGVDMNLVPAWKLGFTGKGVVVTVVDDGLDHTHPDLSPNYDENASFDFNNKSKAIDIDPRPDDSAEAGMANAHGTRCGGEIAAVANNKICGVGAAYEASIGGLRILDGAVTDAMQAAAILYNNNHIDVYSCCWGPPDDGKTFQRPGELLTEALERGAKEGRNGKGSIFVWASGNGGAADDDCSADAYVGNIHTISIGAANDKGESVYFMEKCPSTFAVTLSGGPNKIRSRQKFDMNEVTTTDLHNGCTSSFIGTSSAAPLASGIIALVLHANPSLTWRDVQHIIVHGSQIPNPVEGGWHINGAGYHLNHRFGFGVLDAGKMVTLALTWENVPEQLSCEKPVKKVNIEVSQGETKTIFIDVENCAIKQLEHTQAFITFESPRRGDISIMLYSPFGTPSELLSTRKYDNSVDGIQDWPFMSVHNWGENPNGRWTLEFTYNETPKDAGELPEVIPRKKYKKALLVSVGLKLYGIREFEVNDNPDEENIDKNPAINPEDAGKSNQNTVVDIYNDEQLDDEEIVLDLEDLASAAKVPPNIDHNVDGDMIDTGNFDGVLLGANHNIILDENLLQSLSTKELKTLLREVELEKKALVLKKMLEEYYEKK